MLSDLVCFYCFGRVTLIRRKVCWDRLHTALHRHPLWTRQHWFQNKGRMNRPPIKGPKSPHTRQRKMMKWPGSPCGAAQIENPTRVFIAGRGLLQPGVVRVPFVWLIWLSSFDNMSWQNVSLTHVTVVHNVWYLFEAFQVPFNETQHLVYWRGTFIFYFETSREVVIDQVS